MSIVIPVPITIAFSNIWYVCSVNGIDGGGTAGLNRSRPLATLAQAVANASANDMICCLAGHAETLTATQAIGKSLAIIGQGSVGGNPAVAFTMNAAGNPALFNITAVGVELRNLWLKTNAQANSASRVLVAGVAGFRMLDCYVECGPNDQGPAVALTFHGDNARISNTTFVSTATSAAAQPESAIKATGALTDLELEGVTFSSGATGWSNFYAAALPTTITGLKADRVTQLLGADASGGAASTGRWNAQLASGGAGIAWPSALMLPNGPGEKLGDSVATCKPLQLSGNVWYVRSGIGADAASPAGKNREKPLATLLQAVTNAADDDLIVLMDGHTETLAALLVIAKRLTIVGGGNSTDGLPTVKITAKADGSVGAVSVTTTCVELRNIWFTSALAACPHARVLVAGSDFRMVGCYFDCAGTDTLQALELAAGADRARVAATSFKSTALATASQPESAIKITGAIADLDLDEVVLNGGSYGFSNIWALDGSAAAVTRLRGRSVELISNANAKMNAASSGWMDLFIVTGGPDI